MKEYELREALERAGDWAAFTEWTAHRYKQYSGKFEKGWLYLDGAVHIPTLLRLLFPSPDSPGASGREQ